MNLSTLQRNFEGWARRAFGGRVSLRKYQRGNFGGGYVDGRTESLWSAYFIQARMSEANHKQ